MELRPYQIESVDSIFKEWEDNKSTLLVLPTGCGKTIVAAEVVRKLKEENKKVLFLAHRGELLTQTQDKFSYFNIETSIEKAELHADLENDNIIVASIQSISRDDRLSNYPRDYFDVIIIDECHHSAADTYIKVINYFENAKLLGITATPNRADIRNIADIFETVAYSYNIKDAIKDEYLTPIQIRRIPLEIDLTEVRTSCGDYLSSDLEDALLPYLEKIANQLREKALNRKTLIFTPTIAIGEQMADVLASNGFRASCISSKNNANERAEIINKLHSGELNVVTNAMLLTEGFDEPSVDCIINLRATKSESLFTQIVGRGLRLSPETNKTNLLYLDFLWHTGKNGYNVLNPINLFIDKTRTDIANDILNNGEQVDIFDLSDMADKKYDLAQSLAEKLRNASKRYFCGRPFKEKQNANLRYEYDEKELDKIILTDDACKFYFSSENISYTPYRQWELAKATDKQLELLSKLGFNASNVPYKGLAAALINNVFKNKNENRCSYKQYKILNKKGFIDVEKWSKQEVAKVIDILAKNNWRLPYWLKPATYNPR